MAGRKQSPNHEANVRRWAETHPAELERRRGDQVGETKRQARQRGNKLRSILVGGREAREPDPERTAKNRVQMLREAELRRRVKKSLRQKRREAWYRKNRPHHPLPQA